MPVAPGRVWWGLTSGEALPQWLGTPTSGTFAVGEVVSIKHAEDYLSTSTILASEPQQLLSMTWDFPDEPRSLVSIRLEPDDGATLLTLAHDGLGGEAAGYLPGWHTHLLYLEGALTSRPLDPAGFWTVFAGVNPV